MDKFKKYRSYFLLAAKIAVGSSAAMFIAQLLQLEYSSSAGIIALLTLMTTKWETLKLSLFRLVSFLITMAFGVIAFYLIESAWISYGLFIFLVVFLAFVLGWQATISVNAVLGTHLLLDGHFTVEDVKNELMLVVIGIVIAIVLNLFHDYKHQRKTIVANMRYVEGQMQSLMRELTPLLIGEESSFETWENFERLREQLQEYIKESYDYQDNTFHSHPGYYIDYFEMRQSQCDVLSNLKNEMLRIRIDCPQGRMVYDFMLKLSQNIVELNDPIPQLEEIKNIFDAMRQDAPPQTVREFESRALVYHVLSDLEEFLEFNKRFIAGLNERQIKEYRS